MLCVMRERRIIIIIIIAIISTEYWTIFQMHTKHFQSLIDKSFNIQFAECYLWLNMLNTNDGMQLHTSNGLNVAMSLRISRPMCLYDFGWLLSLFIFFFISIFFGMQCAVDPNDIKVIQYACNSFITRSCCWRLATRCALNQSSLGMVIFDRYCTSFRKCIYTCTLFCLFQCYANKMSIFALDFVCVIAHKFDERLYCVFHIQNTRFNCSYWTFN